MITRLYSIHDEEMTLPRAAELIGSPEEPAFVTRIKLPGNMMLLCDEDGGPRDLPLNQAASFIAGQPVLGTAILLVGKPAMKGWA